MQSLAWAWPDADHVSVSDRGGIPNYGTDAGGLWQIGCVDIRTVTSLNATDLTSNT